MAHQRLRQALRPGSAPDGSTMVFTSSIGASRPGGPLSPCSMELSWGSDIPTLGAKFSGGWDDPSEVGSRFQIESAPQRPHPLMK